MKHPTPRGQQAGFTLIELMIVIAIIAILALIAMPQYQNFVAKSQATAALAEIAPGKVSVETAIADGEVPSTADEIGLQAPTERCTNIDVAFDDSGVGSITCSAIKGSTDVKDANIALERDDTGAWKCTTTIAKEKIMPKGCGT